jgi:predicted phage terminase large subunit-like protein
MVNLSSLSEAERWSEATAELAARLKLRQSLRTWAIEALAPVELKPAAHHLLLLRKLQNLLVGRRGSRRLMVHMPPGAAKSTYGSVLFPVWALAARPRTSVVMACHTASLAEHLGRSVRHLAAENELRLGYELAADDRSAQRFSTNLGGSFFATGVHGPLTGRRADVIIVDDPVKSLAEAESRTARDSLYEWFRVDLLTRLRPGGRVVLIMTRWHPDDLAGRLAADGGWEVLSLPALAEPGDPLGRREGAALWPAWEDCAALEQVRASVGERAWAALYQQSPRVREGGMFDPARIQCVGGDSELGVREAVRGWDLAATAERNSVNPDWTVGVKLGRLEDGRFVILDVTRMRAGPAAVEALIMETAARDGAAVKISLPQDPGQAGKYQIETLVRRLAGYRVAGSVESGSKELRAGPVATQIDAGNVLMIRAVWNQVFTDEIRDFPYGTKDDQIDALSRAFMTLVGTPPPARVLRVPLIGR